MGFLLQYFQPSRVTLTGQIVPCFWNRLARRLKPGILTRTFLRAGMLQVDRVRLGSARKTIDGWSGKAVHASMPCVHASLLSSTYYAYTPMTTS